MRFNQEDPYYITRVLNSLEPKLCQYLLLDSIYHKVKLVEDPFELIMEDLV